MESKSVVSTTEENNAGSDDAVQLRCNVHGSLPAACFYPRDLKRGLKRCRKCADGGARRWLRKQGHRYRLWSLFLRRLKRKQCKVHWSWCKDVKPRVTELLHAKNVTTDQDAKRWRLTWRGEVEQPKKPSAPSGIEDLLLCTRFSGADDA